MLQPDFYGLPPLEAPISIPKNFVLDTVNSKSLAVKSSSRKISEDDFTNGSLSAGIESLDSLMKEDPKDLINQPCCSLLGEFLPISDDPEYLKTSFGCEEKGFNMNSLDNLPQDDDGWERLLNDILDISPSVSKGS